MAAQPLGTYAQQLWYGESYPIFLLHWCKLRPGEKASGPIACKCTGHPPACHCVIRQKIRPNSWFLRILLPLPVLLMHTHVQAHRNAHTHKCFRMIYYYWPLKPNRQRDVNSKVMVRQINYTGKKYVPLFSHQLSSWKRTYKHTLTCATYANSANLKH